MNLLILPGKVESIMTRSDLSYKITIGSQELTHQQAGELVKLNQQFCFIAFKPDMFKKQEEIMLNNLNTELEFKEKPKGQRLKAVLYRLWEQVPEGYDDFTLFYNFRMEQIIEMIKSKLD